MLERRTEAAVDLMEGIEIATLFRRPVFCPAFMRKNVGNLT